LVGIIHWRKAAMAVYDLNAVIKGMQSCLGRSQRRLDRRQERLLQQLIDIGKDGKPKSLSWVSRLPSGDGGQRTYEFMRLPWVSLRSAEAMQIAPVSVAFDCHISQDQQPVTDQPPALTVIPVGKAKNKSPHAHRMSITLKGGGGFYEEISVDDQLIKEAGSDDIHIPWEILERRIAKWRILRALFSWKSISALLLAGLMAAVVLWFLGILRLP
jgi:hypothetical protein